jgi:hypothetical protein
MYLTSASLGSPCEVVTRPRGRLSCKPGRVAEDKWQFLPYAAAAMMQSHRQLSARFNVEICCGREQTVALCC